MSSWLARLAGRQDSAAAEPPEAEAARNEEMQALRIEVRGLASAVAGLGQDVERAGKQQARAVLAMDTAQRAFRDSIDQVRTLAEQRPPAADETAQAAEALRAEIEAATAAALLPVLDSLDESERAARALAEPRRAEDRRVHWGDLVRGAAEVALLSVGGPATAHTPGALQQWADGVALTRRRLEDALAQLGATPIQALDQAFDPRWHRAVEVRPTTDAPENTVVEVVRRGFLIHGRVLRYADVVVAKPREAQERE